MDQRLETNATRVEFGGVKNENYRAVWRDIGTDKSHLFYYWRLNKQKFDSWIIDCTLSPFAKAFSFPGATRHIRLWTNNFVFYKEPIEHFPISPFTKSLCTKILYKNCQSSSITSQCLSFGYNEKIICAEKSLVLVKVNNPMDKISGYELQNCLDSGSEITLQVK